jgi:peptidoglycan/LPS O-acetylase OafA/YrhL
MPRRHDLDALRATAMLLGIVFHTAVQYMSQNEGMRFLDFHYLRLLASALHGFRMPLFFLLSGFFTAMLWRRRGLRSMLRQRFSRIFLPLLVFLPVIWLAFALVETTEPAESYTSTNIWEAAIQGDVAGLVAFVNAGVDVNITNRDGLTPLMIAAAFGHQDATEWLIANGADVNVIVDGYTPLDLAVIYSHTEITELLRNHGGKSGGRPLKIADTGEGILTRNVFRHLWFLWYLWWLVAGFAMCAPLVNRLDIGKLPSRWVLAPLRYLWLIPLTMILYSYMEGVRQFGPDMTGGLLIPPHLYLYYALFFGFGALYYHYPNDIGSDIRHWWLMLIVGLGIVFPLGMQRTRNAESWTLPALFLQATYPWVMTFGLMGLFRHIASNENKNIRYISDSSYFLYLMHLPLVFLVRNVIHTWQMPDSVKFVAVCVVVTGVLLIVYEHLVRYSWLGKFLNGPRQRPARKTAQVTLETSG